jgi:hypothetical protein
MPIFQYQDYQDRYGPSIAEALGHQGDVQAQLALQQGAIAAQAARDRGQMWGNLLGTVGDTAVAIPQHQLQARRQALADQEARQHMALTGLQLDDATRQQAALHRVGAVWDSLRDEQGNVDLDAFQSKISGDDLKYAGPLLAAAEQSATRRQTQQATALKSTQERAGGMLSARDVSPESVTAFFTDARDRRAISGADYARYTARIAADPEKGPEAALREMLGATANKPVFQDPTHVGYDPFTFQPTVQGTPKHDFEPPTTNVQGPKGEPLSFDKVSRTYFNMVTNQPEPNPVFTKKPTTPEEDKARWIAIQTQTDMGQPVSPADLAWAKAYGKEKLLTVDASAAAAAGRQAAAIGAQTAEQRRAQDFAEQQAGRRELTDKVETPYRTAVTSAQTLRDVVTDAKAGNKVAASLQNLQTTMAAIRSQGLNRINQTEIGTTAGAGSVWDRLVGWMGHATEGQPVPPDVQNDMLKYADILEKAAYDNYKTGHAAITERYKLTDEKPLPAPGAARSGGMVTLRAPNGQTKQVRADEVASYVAQGAVVVP